MEVPGRTQDSSFTDSKGRYSRGDNTVNCEPCMSEGDTMVAIGYCQYCNEYLCAVCLKVHRKQAVSRNHSILDGDNMPNVTHTPGTMSACSYICTKHSTEIIKYYCLTHDTVGCGDCMIIDHKSCKVDRIQDISTEYFNGVEHQDIMNKVEQFVKDMDEIKEKLKTSGKNIKQTCLKVIKDVKSFKKEIIVYLDKAEEEILALIKERKQVHGTLIQNLKDEGNYIDDDIREMQTKLQLQQNQANDLFVQAKQVKAQLNATDQSLKKLKKDSSIDIFKFRRSSYMEKMIKSCLKLGEIAEESGEKFIHGASNNEYETPSQETDDQKCSDKKSIANMDAYFDCEINIKSYDDSLDCAVYDCALISSSQIIITDYDNKCVKLVNVCNKKVTKFKLKYRPFGVAIVDIDLNAITYPDEKKIEFLEVTTCNKITKRNMINIHAKCKRIAVYEDKIIGITYKSIEIMSMSGQKIKSISHPNMTCLMDIAVVPSLKMPHVYVSNGCGNTKCVYKLDSDGNLISTYEDKDLNEVTGLDVTGDGTVLACNWGIDGSIHMITPDCKKVKEILKRNEHVHFPFCTAFCNETNKLFVANNEARLEKKHKNALNVFQLK